MAVLAAVLAAVAAMARAPVRPVAGCFGMQPVLMIELILVHVTSDNDTFCCRYCNSCHRYMLIFTVVSMSLRV